MHPVFQSAKRVLAYVLSWLAGSLMLAGLLRLQGPLNWVMALQLAVPLSIIYALICLTPWYTCRSLPLASTSPGKIVAHHLGAAVLATAVWMGAGRVVAAVFDFDDLLRPTAPLVIAVGICEYGIAVAVHYVLLALEASRDSAIQARDSELRALKAQINPHFLFNSLNSIAALTASDPARAREMCIGLSGFLRNTLGMGERESISWKEEVQLARMYLEVEQIRFGRRLKVEMNLDEACSDCQVPPLLFQPLIENAIKHGIATLVDGGTIRVESRMKDNALVATVENHFDPDSPRSRPSGLGLRNVRSRLETRFGSAAWLSTGAEQGLYRASLSVPCRKTDWSAE